MKVKIRYKQSQPLPNIYLFYRIIRFKEPNRMFKTKIKTEMYHSVNFTPTEYMNKVRAMLKFDKQSLVDSIKPEVEEVVGDPSSLRNDIRKYEREIEL